MPLSAPRPAASWSRVALAGVLALAACKPSANAANGAAGAPASPASATAAGAPATAPGATPAASPILARADSGRIKGSPTAPVWLIEISDFQCPFCKVWHDETYPAIVREYVETGKVRMAYVHYPLNNHPNALPAAEASMCASAQGKFWEVHSAIFATQEAWARLPDASAHFDSLAARAGVNAAEWRDCMRTHVTLPLIEADRDRGSSVGVRSTPSFLIGSEAISGAQPIGAFREAIERALRAAPPGQGR